MSIQWTCIAGYLYFEIALVIIMTLPIVSPRRWHIFFKSCIFAVIRQHGSEYFYVMLATMGLFLIDAVTDMNKYSGSSDLVRTHLLDDMKLHMKLFRAQRNFYITCFATFLTFVIRRLVTMLIIQDELGLKAETLKNEAKAMVEHAKVAIQNKLEKTEIMLNDERKLVQKLKVETENWKLKYEELSNRNVKGDE